MDLHRTIDAETISQWRPESNVGVTCNKDQKYLPMIQQADRFIPVKPRNVPLNISPRTKRFARSFGLIDDRIFKFSDVPTLTSQPQHDIYALLRESASQLNKKPVTASSTSAVSHLGKMKQSVLSLDDPGIIDNQFSYPLSWSLTNCIAIACGRDVYYQNLDTRTISQLCRVQDPQAGSIHCIEWGGKTCPNIMAVGTTKGMVQLWDATRSPDSEIGGWSDCSRSVGCISWCDHILAVGRHRGTLALYDTRARDAVKTIMGHKHKLRGVKWNHDGTFLASSDRTGLVYIWDARAGKFLLDDSSRRLKIKHKASVKVRSVPSISASVN